MKKSLFFGILGLMLVFSMFVVSAYDNGYCVPPYNSDQYSYLTKTKCLDENLDCPINSPYIFYLNDAKGCVCTSSPDKFGSYSNICIKNIVDLKPILVKEVYSWASSVSGGSQVSVGVDCKSNTPGKNMYSKFDLTSLSGKTIEKVEYIYEYGGDYGSPRDGMNVNIYQYSNLKSDINWNNKLSMGNLISSQNVPITHTTNEALVFDVTNYVKSKIGGTVEFGFDSNYCLGLGTTGGGYNSYQSVRGGYLKITTKDYSQECTKGKVTDCIPLQPLKPQPSAFSIFIQSIVNWIHDLFQKIFPTMSIAGATNIEPNTQETYQIDLSTTLPDSDYLDGNYSVQWANWALVDSSGNIKQQGTWEEINGRYQKSVTITTPQNIGNYMLIGLIDQIDMTYDYTSKTWSKTESIVNKEAINLINKFNVIAPLKPQPSGFQNLINSIKNFFCSRFGWFCF